MEDALIIADDEALFVDANEKARKLFPYLNPLEYHDPLPDKLKTLFSAEQQSVRLEGSSYLKKIRKSRGYEGRSYIILSDDTEREELLKEVEEARKSAEVTNMTNSVFLSNVSHEIRTPMNAIVGMADILLREELNPRSRECLDNIKASVDMLLSVVNDILDVSKIKDGSLNIIEQEYEPMSVLNDLSVMFLNRIGDKPIELIFSIDKDLPEKLFGDSKRIKQVLVNLLNNAVRFTEAGFICLTIKVEEKEDDFCLLSFSIEDSGRGIGEEEKEELFSPFLNDDTSGRDGNEGPGLGLGLTICRQLIRIMGGEIGVESTFGSGSRFFFTISQDIINPSPAATLKESARGKAVYHAFRNSYAEESFLRMSEQYGIRTVEYSTETLRDILAGGETAGYLFTDDPGMIGEANLPKLSEADIRLCILTDPLSSSSRDKGDEGFILVNKPLYSLNFCQILNENEFSGNERTYELNFTAPEARILIVDDNEMNIQVAKGLLAPLNMRIDTADNGKTGVESVLGASYDIIFMDHMMPVMDGIEAMEKIRSLSGGNLNDLPIIALSANATAEAEELFREKGFTDFIAKPIRIKELIKCILTWLPEEKIIRGNKETEPEDISLPKEEVVIPSEIEGLNVEEGISYCGSPALFLKCIVIFYRIIDKKAKIISDYLEDGCVRELTIEVHALKNSARMIGAAELSADFKELERLGNEDDLKALNEKVPPVLDLYLKYKGILKPFADTEKKNSYIPKKEEVIEKLEKIRDAMDSFDMDGADEAMGVLRDYALPGNLNDRIMDLDALVSDFAMEDVIRLSNELIEECEGVFDGGESV